MDISYDVVTCIGKDHLEIGIRSLRSLIKFSQAKKIFAISSHKNIIFIKEIYQSSNI